MIGKPEQPLAGKAAIVTGAGSGLGRSPETVLPALFKR